MRPAFKSGAIELLATNATVYSAGFDVSAGTCKFLCWAVWLAVTLTASVAHSFAAAATTRNASKSLDRIATRPLATPQSAKATEEDASAAARPSTEAARSGPTFFMFSFLPFEGREFEKPRGSLAARDLWRQCPKPS